MYTSKCCAWNAYYCTINRNFLMKWMCRCHFRGLSEGSCITRHFKSSCPSSAGRDFKICTFTEFRSCRLRAGICGIHAQRRRCYNIYFPCCAGAAAFMRSAEVLFQKLLSCLFNQHILLISLRLINNCLQQKRKRLADNHALRKPGLNQIPAVNGKH